MLLLSARKANTCMRFMLFGGADTHFRCFYGKRPSAQKQVDICAETAPYYCHNECNRCRIEVTFVIVLKHILGKTTRSGRWTDERGHPNDELLQESGEIPLVNGAKAPHEGDSDSKARRPCESGEEKYLHPARKRLAPHLVGRSDEVVRECRGLMAVAAQQTKTKQAANEECNELRTAEQRNKKNQCPNADTDSKHQKGNPDSDTEDFRSAEEKSVRSQQKDQQRSNEEEQLVKKERGEGNGGSFAGIDPFAREEKKYKAASAHRGGGHHAGKLLHHLHAKVSAKGYLVIRKPSEAKRHGKVLHRKGEYSEGNTGKSASGEAQFAKSIRMEALIEQNAHNPNAYKQRNGNAENEARAFVLRLRCRHAMLCDAR